MGDTVLDKDVVEKWIGTLWTIEGVLYYIIVDEPEPLLEGWRFEYNFITSTGIKEDDVRCVTDQGIASVSWTLLNTFGRCIG